MSTSYQPPSVEPVTEASEVGSVKGSSPTAIAIEDEIDSTPSPDNHSDLKGADDITVPIDRSESSQTAVQEEQPIVTINLEEQDAMRGRISPGMHDTPTPRPRPKPTFDFANPVPKPIFDMTNNINSGRAEDDQARIGERAPSPSMASTLTTHSAVSNGTHHSGSSNGSASTVTQPGNTPRRGQQPWTQTPDRLPSRGRHPTRVLETDQKTDVMAYLDQERSPGIRDYPRQPTVAVPPWGLPPQYASPPNDAASSAGNSFTSEVFSDLGIGYRTDGSTVSGPGRSVAGNSPRVHQLRHDHNKRGASYERQQMPFTYATPDMGQGNFQGPPPAQQQQQQQQLGPSPMQQFGGGHMNQFQNVETAPTGYELLALKLSVDSTGKSALQPMYRRFETLNHRLLLHLQDELMELEEQLGQFDTADTQARSHPHCTVPASRRQEILSGNEMYWHKNELLLKIGYKLVQYNKVLASFQKTQTLPTPSISAVDNYRNYVAAYKPIVDNELRFLAIEEDLATLSPLPPPPMSNGRYDLGMDGPTTPMPQKNIITFPPTPNSPYSEVSTRFGAKPSKPRHHSKSSNRGTTSDDATALVVLCAAMAAAFVFPILAFTAIPGYIGRVIVIVLVGFGAVSAGLQSGLVAVAGSERGAIGMPGLLLGFGLYGASMATIAAVM